MVPVQVFRKGSNHGLLSPMILTKVLVNGSYETENVHRDDFLQVSFPD